MTEGASQEELDRIEKEIKAKEAKALEDTKTKAEKEVRDKIAKEQELLDLKKNLADIETEKKKMEDLVLEQKKQHENEVEKLNSEIGQSKAIHKSQSQMPQEQKPNFSEEQTAEISQESQRQFEELMDKRIRNRG